jgi:glycosyltransferase involved in cell wall biosynthesis
VTRVAFTTLAPFISGAERSLQVTVRHLPAAGVAPLVIGPPGAAIAPWCRESDVPFLACPLAFRDKWHPFRWWWSVRQLRGLLRRHRVDLVHANQMWSYPAAGAAGHDLGLPRVCHLRDEANPETLHWCCVAGVEAVVCISTHVARQARAAWPSERSGPMLETLLNPVELPELYDALEQRRLRSESRRRLGIPDGVTVLGFIGQIRAVKGLLGLLDVLAALPTRRWRLLVAGRDPEPGANYEKRCRERAEQPDLAGRVQFLGFLEDTASFYQAIDLAIVPSQEEPLGRVPLEAAAWARPSLAFAVGGLPDVVQHGETGWLVPAADWAALAQALVRFLEQPDPEIGEAARAWVEQAANPAQYAQRLAAFYGRLTGKGDRAASPSMGEVSCSHC